MRGAGEEAHSEGGILRENYLDRRENKEKIEGKVGKLWRNELGENREEVGGKLGGVSKKLGEIGGKTNPTTDPKSRTMGGNFPESSRNDFRRGGGSKSTVEIGEGERRGLLCFL